MVYKFDAFHKGGATEDDDLDGKSTLPGLRIAQQY